MNQGSVEKMIFPEQEVRNVTLGMPHDFIFCCLAGIRARRKLWHKIVGADIRLRQIYPGSVTMLMCCR